MEDLYSLIGSETGSGSDPARSDSSGDDPATAFCSGLNALYERPEADDQSDILELRLRLGPDVARVTAEQFNAVVMIELPDQTTHIVCIGGGEVRHGQFDVSDFADPVMDTIPLIRQAQTIAWEADAARLEQCEGIARNSGTPIDALTVRSLFSKLAHAEAA
jgi:hypothetical protein